VFVGVFVGVFVAPVVTSASTFGNTTIVMKVGVNVGAGGTGGVFWWTSVLAFAETVTALAGCRVVQLQAITVRIKTSIQREGKTPRCSREVRTEADVAKDTCSADLATIRRKRLTA